jgi:hypothetical protein
LNKLPIHMNKTSLAITVLAIVAATAIGFIATQSAAAQIITVPTPGPTTGFNTNNSASQSASQTGAATGGNGGIAVGGSANGGDARVDQAICQQAAQSGAFGSSTNSISGSSCD